MNIKLLKNTVAFGLVVFTAMHVYHFTQYYDSLNLPLDYGTAPVTGASMPIHSGTAHVTSMVTVSSDQLNSTNETSISTQEPIKDITNGVLQMAESDKSAVKLLTRMLEVDVQKAVKLLTRMLEVDVQKAAALDSIADTYNQTETKKAKSFDLIVKYLALIATALVVMTVIRKGAAAAAA
jgi:hypothetical protein